MRRGFGVLLLAEGDGSLDQDCLLAYVAPLQRQRFARSQAGVGQDADQRGVARAAGGTHPLDGCGWEWPDFGASRPRCLADSAGGVALDLSALECALKDRAKQVEGVADRNPSVAVGEPVSLPAGDRLRRDRPERERAKLGQHMFVEQLLVVQLRLPRQARAVGRRPRVDHVVGERDTPAIDSSQRPHLLPPPDLRCEQRGSCGRRSAIGTGRPASI